MGIGEWKETGVGEVCMCFWDGNDVDSVSYALLFVCLDRVCTAALHNKHHTGPQFFFLRLMFNEQFNVER